MANLLIGKVNEILPAASSSSIGGFCKSLSEDEKPAITPLAV